jgi:hypothetical protein
MDPTTPARASPSTPVTMSELEDLPFPPEDEPIESDDETRTADSYSAVHRGERVLLLRDQHPLPKKHAEDIAPQPRDLEILRALWRYRFLLTSQIADEWWSGKSLYAAQRRLSRMTAAGWVTRFRPRLSKGKHEWIYQLDRKGFDSGKRCWGLDGHTSKRKPNGARATSPTTALSSTTSR